MFTLCVMMMKSRILVLSIIPLLYDEKSANISIQGPDLRRNTELSCGKEGDHLGSLWDQKY